MDTAIGFAGLFVSLAVAGGGALAWVVRRLDCRFDEAREERNQLRADLAKLQADLAKLRADLAKLQVELANRASKMEGLVEGMWKALALRFGAESPPEPRG